MRWININWKTSAKDLTGELWRAFLNDEVSLCLSSYETGAYLCSQGPKFAGLNFSEAFQTAYVPRVIISRGAMFPRFYVPRVVSSLGIIFPWSHVNRSYFAKFCLLRVLSSQGPIFPKSYVPRGKFCHGPMFPGSKCPWFYVPRV